MKITIDSNNFIQDYNISNFEIHGSYLFGDLHPMRLPSGVVIANGNDDVQLFDSITTLTLSLPYHDLQPQVESNSNLTNSTVSKDENDKPYIVDPYLYRYPPNMLS